MKSAKPLYPMNERESHEHISLKLKQYPSDHRPVLTIHDKNGRAHASWAFKDVQDLEDFADMIQRYCKRLVNS